MAAQSEFSNFYANGIRVNEVEKSENGYIRNAKIIKTAIECTLVDESAYETMTTTFGNKIIKIDSMEIELPIEITSEIRRQIGDIELKPEYIEEGILGFSFSVGTDGVVTVYVYDSENDAKYELVPETDEDYIQ